MKSVISLVLVSLIFSSSAFAKNVVYRKTQKVEFDGSDVDGVSRNPDGSYLLQKRGVKFLPLYKVKKKFDKEIRSSVEYLR